VADLRRELEELLEGVDCSERIASDPVRFVHRYSSREDQEIAGLFAALMAYGRVDLFLPLLDGLFEHMDSLGGPRTWVETLNVEAERSSLAEFQYRWTRGSHLVLLAACLQRVVQKYGDIQSLFLAGWTPQDENVRGSLIYAVEWLRKEAVSRAEECGLSPALPRGVKFLLASPESGSACKRWNLYLRWMVRPAQEGVDAGVWKEIPPSALVLPLDTHTHRLSRFLGLTTRQDGSWRTAVEITDGLRKIDPEDPVRFDFALAHLGISGFCKGYQVASVCGVCPLESACVAPSSPR